MKGDRICESEDKARRITQTFQQDETFVMKPGKMRRARRNSLIEQRLQPALLFVAHGAFRDGALSSRPAPQKRSSREQDGERPQPENERTPGEWRLQEDEVA